jgi:hypothetical protein
MSSGSMPAVKSRKSSPEMKAKHAANFAEHNRKIAVAKSDAEYAAKEPEMSARRAKALEGLRAVESATKARNVSRAAQSASSSSSNAAPRASSSNAAPRAPEEDLSELYPDVVKNLKVGDKIAVGQHSGYMGDGGDSRDVGYTFTSTITKKDKGRFIGTPRYSDGQPLVFTKYIDNAYGLGWLRTAYYEVFAINGVSREKESRNMERQAKISQYVRGQYAAKSAAHSAKVAEDYTKMTSKELRDAIEEKLKTEGKRLTNLGTAKKALLLKAYEKYVLKK